MNGRISGETRVGESPLTLQCGVLAAGDNETRVCRPGERVHGLHVTSECGYELSIVCTPQTYGFVKGGGGDELHIWRILDIVHHILVARHALHALVLVVAPQIQRVVVRAGDKGLHFIRADCLVALQGSSAQFLS